MSISSLATHQSNALSNPVNAPHFSEIKAKIELANRQKAPVIPGTSHETGASVMPGSHGGSPRAPGSVFQAYA